MPYWEIIRATGLVGAFAKLHYDATAFGMFQNSRHHTQKYSKRSDNGKRVSKKEMTFKNGIPTVTGSEPRMDY